LLAWVRWFPHYLLPANGGRGWNRIPKEWNGYYNSYSKKWVKNYQCSYPKSKPGFRFFWVQMDLIQNL
jgi:hypothetical protein